MKTLKTECYVIQVIGRDDFADFYGIYATKEEADKQAEKFQESADLFYPNNREIEIYVSLFKKA